MKKRAIFYISLISLLAAAASINTVKLLCYAEENKKEGLFVSRKITVEGTLVKIKMGSSAGAAPWEETGIRAADGTLYILIGKAVKEIRDDIGKKYKITGSTKPPMTGGGVLIPVIQIKIHKASGEAETEK